jgi:hypothetical protein
MVAVEAEGEDGADAAGAATADTVVAVDASHLPTPANYWKVKVSIAFYFNMVGFMLGNWVARIPSVKEVHDLDDAMFGLVLVTALVGACLCLPIVTPVVERFGSCAGVLVG